MKFNTKKVVIPGRRVRPAGFYDYKVVSIEETVSKSGLLMFVLTLQPHAPEQFRGTRSLTHYIVLGKNAWDPAKATTDEDREYFLLSDPMCETELCREKRAGELLGIMRDMGWERATDEDVNTEDFVDDVNNGEYFIGARTVVRTEEGGEYAGQERNEIAFFYKVGTHEPAIDAPKTGARKGSGTGRSTEQRTPRNRSRAATEAAVD